jgi:hypothetical protein
MFSSNLSVKITMVQGHVCSDMIEYHKRNADKFRDMARGAHLKRDKADYKVRAMVHDEMAQFWSTVEIIDK